MLCSELCHYDIHIILDYSCIRHFVAYSMCKYFIVCDFVIMLKKIIHLLLFLVLSAFLSSKLSSEPVSDLCKHVLVLSVIIAFADLAKR